MIYALCYVFWYEVHYQKVKMLWLGADCLYSEVTCHPSLGSLFDDTQLCFAVQRHANAALGCHRCQVISTVSGLLCSHTLCSCGHASACNTVSFWGWCPPPPPQNLRSGCAALEEMHCAFIKIYATVCQSKFAHVWQLYRAPLL